MSLGGGYALASAHLSDEVGLLGHVVAGDVFAIPGSVGGFDGLAVDLGEEDVDDGLEYGFGCAFKEVGNAHTDLAIAKANGIVDVSEGIELSAELGDGRARAEFAIGFLQ